MRCCPTDDRIQSVLNELAANDAVFPSECSSEVLVGEPDETGLCKWRSRKSEMPHRAVQIEEKYRLKIPKALKHLVSNFSYAALDIGGFLLFANSENGEGSEDWHRRLLVDELTTNTLLDAGLLLIGRSTNHASDFAVIVLAGPDRGRVCTIEHEALLQLGKVHKRSGHCPTVCELFKGPAVGVGACG